MLPWCFSACFAPSPLQSRPRLLSLGCGRKRANLPLLLQLDTLGPEQSSAVRPAVKKHQPSPASAFARTRSRVFSLSTGANRAASRAVEMLPCFGGLVLLTCCLFLGYAQEARGQAGMLLAGAAKVDITNYDAGPVHDPLFVKALALKSDQTVVVLVTLDAVAVGEIGSITNDYLPQVREQLQRESGILPAHILVNASHCHGVVCADVEARTVQAVQKALQELVPVRIGAGLGQENRIMENRRIKLKSGREADVRHAYALPPDDEIAEVGPIDPQIGILRLDRQDGRTLAVVYNFAMHPIQSVPGGRNTADVSGFASQVIEDSLGDGAIALFLQGCGGDINPIFYKDVAHPRSAEPLGNLLGLSTLKAVRQITCKDDSRLKIIPTKLTLPRGDRTEVINQLTTEQERLLMSLRGTSLNLKTFLPLIMRYQLDPKFPSYYAHRYLHDERIGRDDLQQLDAENRRNMEAYLQNIKTMEELTRLQINLSLLRKHQAKLMTLPTPTVEVEVVGLRVGDFLLTTFPGELTVGVGLSIKQKATRPHTYVAGYTNGYIYYAPTAEQLKNVGHAQEDSDCILAPEWQALFETRVAELLEQL